MPEPFSRTIEGGPLDPSGFERLGALHGWLAVQGARLGGRLLSAASVGSPEEEPLASPEFMAGQQAVAAAVESIFDLRYSGQLVPHPRWFHRPPRQGSYDERLTFAGNVRHRIPKVVLEYNRPGVAVLLGARSTRSVRSDTEPLKDTLIAAYRVQGTGPAGPVSYGISLHDHRAYWEGVSQLPWPEEDPRRHRREATCPQTLQQFAHEIREVKRLVAGE